MCLSTRYDGWMCSSCRKECTIGYPFSEEDEELFEWLYYTSMIQTPTSIGEFLSHADDDYEPITSELESLQKRDPKQELRQWLTSTGFTGRCRSTDSYASMKRRDQMAVCRQMKEVFRHILNQFVSNDSDTVWEDLIERETRKPAEIRKR